MFKSKIRNGLPEYTHNVDPEVDKKFESNGYFRNFSKRDHTRAPDINIKCGNQLIVKQPKVNKLKPHFNINPYIITAIKGIMIIAEHPVTKHQITRNISHFKFLPWTAAVPKARFDTEEEEEEVPSIQKPHHYHQNAGDVQHHQQTHLSQIN